MFVIRTFRTVTMVMAFKPVDDFRYINEAVSIKMSKSITANIAIIKEPYMNTIDIVQIVRKM